MNKAIFLDRDGTLNLDTSHPSKLEELFVLEWASDALKILKKMWYLLIGITNQSWIGRWYYTTEQFHLFNKLLEETLWTKLDAWYRCPDLPDAWCICRKPKPGMLLQATQEYDIDLFQSRMIGDSLTDIQAGHHAWCQTIFLWDDPCLESDYTCNSLLAASLYLQWLFAISQN